MTNTSLESRPEELTGAEELEARNKRARISVWVNVVATAIASVAILAAYFYATFHLPV